jgi:hypothetical protein
MKYWKTLGVAALAAVTCVLAVAASASATTVTGPSGETTPTFHIVHEGTHMEMHNAIVNIQCNLTLVGTVSSHGSGVTANAALSTFQLTNCTNEWVFDVNSLGSLEIHYKDAGIGHGIGTVTWTGARLTSTRAGLSCIYETKATPIGTLTGGSPATLAISANIPRVGGSFLCGGSTAQWTGSLVTTNTLKIDP